jgi:hypothetical protein
VRAWVNQFVLQRFSEASRVGIGAHTSRKMTLPFLNISGSLL